MIELVTQTNGTENANEILMKTAYSYIRFSTKKQALGDSLRRQIETAERVCKQLGYRLDTSLKPDKGISAWKGKNAKFGSLGTFLEMIEDGRVKGHALCVENLDRITRADILTALELFIRIINSGVTIITSQDGMVYNRESITRNPGELQISIAYMVRANNESEVKSERVAEACKQRKEQGKKGKKFLTWNPPWCDFSEEKGYVPNPTRVAVVKRIYDEYLAGNGPYRISRKFNQEKVPILGHRGKTIYKNTTQVWYKKTVRDFLFDKRVYGYAEHLEKEGYYPVIVSKDTFSKVQNRIALQANSKPTGGQTANVGNLFTGICKCARCHSVMSKTFSTKKYKGKVTQYNYLICEGAAGGTNCSYRSFSYDRFEQSFLATLCHTDFYQYITGSGNGHKEADSLSILHGELAVTEKQITKITKLILNDDNPSQTLVFQLKEQESNKKSILKGIELAQAKFSVAKSMPENFVELVRAGSQTVINKAKDPKGRLEIRQYILNTVDKIFFDTENGKTNYQIYLKNGQVLSVILWREREPHNQATDWFQILPGVKTERSKGPVMALIKGRDVAISQLRLRMGKNCPRPLGPKEPGILIA